jgi:hypothetical protein
MKLIRHSLIVAGLNFILIDYIAYCYLFRVGLYYNNIIKYGYSKIILILSCIIFLFLYLVYASEAF